MTIHTTTADQNGNFSIKIGTALTNGETIEVTAQNDDQSKTIVIQAPSEPYLAPISNNDNLLVGQDGSFAIVLQDQALHSTAAAHWRYLNNPFRFTKGASIRLIDGVYLIKPNISSDEPDTPLAPVLWFSLRFPISVLQDNFNSSELVVKYTYEANSEFDSVNWLPGVDEMFDGGTFEFQGDAKSILHNRNYRGSGYIASTLQYVYINIPLNFGIKDGKAVNADGMTDAVRKYSVFGNVFKTQLDKG